MRAKRGRRDDLAHPPDFTGKEIEAWQRWSDLPKATQQGRIHLGHGLLVQPDPAFIPASLSFPTCKRRWRIWGIVIFSGSLPECLLCAGHWAGCINAS